ncbi:ParB/RepB/Spo0J family partition protein [Serratia sp. T13T92]|uniref:ParB/RepB/Spo0J family partition protein n=1 Tax=Serratia sp. T13T92 TaxID=3397496 RepID=UPI0039DFAD32
MTKAKTPKVKTAVAQFVETALVDALVEIVTLKQLVKTPLNARKTPVPEKEVRELAASIEAAGLLQNLIVFPMDNGLFGVAGGETRRLALNILMEESRSAAGVPVTSEFPVPVKVVDEDKARAISYAENGQRSNLSPADQLANFRELAEEGKPVEQIAAILGYRTAHVKKCLKLTTVAPQLLELLKTDDITLDQLGALSSTDDHQRQIQTWDNSKHYEYKRTVKALRESVLNDEVSAAESTMVDFVGLDAYQAAGGEIRDDLFAESVILTNAQQLEAMAVAKLQEAADLMAKEEGWLWSLGRSKVVQSWGGDEKLFEILDVPTKLTSEQKAEAKQLTDEKKQLEEQLDGADADDEWEHAPRVEQITARLAEINNNAEINKWSAKVRAKAGIVAYLKDGKIRFQRGLMKMEDVKQAEKVEREKIKKETPPSEMGLSSVLVTSLSSERTLAVMAALVQNPAVALALHTHTMATKVFGTGYTTTVLDTRLEIQRSTLLNNAPTAAEGAAEHELSKLYAQWKAKLPEGWKDDFSWLLAWEAAEILALLAFCVGLSLNGVQSFASKEGKVGDKLTTVENALEFDLCDWWKPTKENYFGRISKEQISDALLDAGKSAQAASALKMKKGDAAQLAEDELATLRWLPNCFRPAAEDKSTADTASDNPIAE